MKAQVSFLYHECHGCLGTMGAFSLVTLWIWISWLFLRSLLPSLGLEVWVCRMWLGFSQLVLVSDGCMTNEYVVECILLIY